MMRKSKGGYRGKVEEKMVDWERGNQVVPVSTNQGLECPKQEGAQLSRVLYNTVGRQQRG